MPARTPPSARPAAVSGPERPGAAAAPGTDSGNGSVPRPGTAVDAAVAGPADGGGGSAKGWNPRPFVLDRAKGVILDGAITFALTAVFAAAARNAGGRMRLTLALLMVGVFAGIFQVLGALFARRTREELAKGPYVFVAVLFVKIAVFAVLLGPLVFSYAGISTHQRDVIMTGAAAGALASFTGWAVGLRFVYRPPVFPRWWLRGSMQAGVVLGAAVALAVSP